MSRKRGLGSSDYPFGIEEGVSAAALLSPAAAVVGGILGGVFAVGFAVVAISSC